MYEEDKHLKDWLKFLNADEVKFQLITASLYITAYDLLISTIIEKIKDFYINEFDNKPVDIEYRLKVKSLYKKDVVIASLIWLKNNSVINDSEVEQVKCFKDHRNELAHELPMMITDSNKRTKTEYVQEIRNLYFKIHEWWFKEFELSVNPPTDDINIDELDMNEVLSMIMLPMDYICNIINDEVMKIEQVRSDHKI